MRELLGIRKTILGWCAIAQEGVERGDGDAVHASTLGGLYGVQAFVFNHVPHRGGRDSEFVGDLLHGVEVGSVGWELGNVCI